MDFYLDSTRRTSAAAAPRPSPPTNPIPISRGTSAPMAIGAAGGKRNRAGYMSSGGGGGGGGGRPAMYSQSLPARPRAPIMGSLPAPRSSRFEEMPSLELPPSFSDDEVVQSFGAPGTSLSSSSMMSYGRKPFAGYASSCPAPSFMMSARSLHAKQDRDSSGSASNISTSSTGASTPEAHGAGATADAQTPSFNSLVGSRTALSVLMEVDETKIRLEDDARECDAPVVASLVMENIKLESIDLGPSTGLPDGYGDGAEGGNISSGGDDNGGLFAMED